MLEEDQIRFDAFLKENDRKAHQAMKRCVSHSLFYTKTTTDGCIIFRLILCSEVFFFTKQRKEKEQDNGRRASHSIWWTLKENDRKAHEVMKRCVSRPSVRSCFLHKVRKRNKSRTMISEQRIRFDEGKRSQSAPSYETVRVTLTSLFLQENSSWRMCLSFSYLFEVFLHKVKRWLNCVLELLVVHSLRLSVYRSADRLSVSLQ